MSVDGAPPVVFHFAQFKRISAAWFDSGQLEYGIMPRRLRSRLYGGYWAALESAETEMRVQRPDFALARRGWRLALGEWHIARLRLFWGQFWWRAGSQWIAGRWGLGRFRGTPWRGIVVAVTPCRLARNNEVLRCDRDEQKLGFPRATPTH